MSTRPDRELSGFIEILHFVGDTTYTDIGTTYAEGGKGALMRTKVDFSKFLGARARILVGGCGNEAGAGKGVEIYNLTDGVQICEATWDGTSVQSALTSAWVTLTLNREIILTVRVKGASATEDIFLNRVALQILTEGHRLLRG